MTEATREKIDNSTVTVIYGRLLKEYVAPYKGRVILAMLFMMVSAATAAATAFVMKPIVDEVFFEQNPIYIYYTTAAVAVIFALRGFSAYGQTVLMDWVGTRVVSDIQLALFKKIVSADLAWFHSNPTGNLISRFVFETNQLKAAATQTLVALTKDSLTAVFLIASLFYYDWRMALVILIALPPGALAIRQLVKRSRKAFHKVMEQTADFSIFLDEHFQGIRVVKAYGREKEAEQRGREVIDERFRYQFKALRIQASSSPIVETLSGLIIAGVIFYGASNVVDGHTTPGTFFAFITAVMLTYQPVKSVAKIFPQMQNGMVAAHRIFDLLDIVYKVVDKPDAVPLEFHKGKIEFEGVSFSYNENEPVLKNISLQLNAGKRIALVGPSGGGKSTILNLIPRFYNVNDGRILLDGQDVRDVTMASVRDKIALVSQDVFLFDASIKANIAYGRDEVSDEEILAAARSAAVHDFVSSLPDGYETLVGSDGVRLSGGQKQRIAIARAMLKDAPILLLDEATSALDTDSERKIQIALKELMKGRTSLVIAHRLSTILDADMINVIVAGEVVETGTHDELLVHGGVYADLYNNQFALDDSVTPFPQIRS
ncbi:ABC transporter transmembrane domain-containing protein [Sneathiella marina]|uniref:ABC transporter transmembrane domain-containing protein n=1 Tax=Sneathiella marina TaxID=2950108 RepID=A0ABY4W0Z2_9PROT|nr:ABC transporter transmembrane domain-containing protein [Sneathiella marina]USG60838.1 ABC transporter transmembrane domain-containing protein [Sneathiella marina]